MIYFPAVALSTFLVLLYLLAAALFPWQAWAELFRRAAKYVRVTWEQMRPEDRQAYAVRAGIVVWYVVWSVAIVRGTP
jgi:hypothetical protein